MAPTLGERPPQPAQADWREADFLPLPGTSPRAWLTREAGECAFPVGDGEGQAQLSCCAPAVGRAAYCPAHHRIVFKPVAPEAREAQARRWAEGVERWAA